MSKESYYFPHDYDPTGDPKMQALLGEFGGSGYGVFWRIIEMMHSDCNHKLPLKQYIYLAIAKQMLTSAEQIKAIIDYCIDPCELFEKDGDFFYSNRVNSNFEKRSQISEVRSVAGKAGAIAKQKLANTSKGKERKGKEIKELNIEFSQFWNMYLRKEGSKKNCEVKWNNLKDQDRDKIIKTLPLFFSKIKDKQFYPYPETYLNQRRWENEPDIIEKPIIKDEGWGKRVIEPDPVYRHD